MQRTIFQMFDRQALVDAGATIYETIDQVPYRVGRYKIACLTAGCPKVNNIQVRRDYSGVLRYQVTSCYLCGMMHFGALTPKGRGKTNAN